MKSTCRVRPDGKKDSSRDSELGCRSVCPSVGVRRQAEGSRLQSAACSRTQTTCATDIWMCPPTGRKGVSKKCPTVVLLLLRLPLPARRRQRLVPGQRPAPISNAVVATTVTPSCRGAGGTTETASEKKDLAETEARGAVPPPFPSLVPPQE